MKSVVRFYLCLEFNIPVVYSMSEMFFFNVFTIPNMGICTVVQLKFNSYNYGNKINVILLYKVKINLIALQKHFY